MNQDASRDVTKVREYNLSRTELIETIKLCLNNIENITNPNLISDILSDLFYLQKCKRIETNTRRQFEFIHESRIKENMNILVKITDANTNATDLLWAQLAQQKLYKLFEQMSMFTWDCSDSERIILRDISKSHRLKHTAPNPDEAIHSIFSFTKKYAGGHTKIRRKQGRKKTMRKTMRKTKK